MQASLIIYVCSETLMLLALQHRKLRHHFYIITLDIFALSFFFPSKHSKSKLSPKYPWKASLSHFSSACSFLGFVLQDTPARLADFAALLPATTKDSKRIMPKDETQQLAPSTPQHGWQQGGYLCVWGHWGQALNFSLDFAAFVNHWIDGAAHGRLTALLALGKKTRREMAPRFGMTDRQWPTSSSKINVKISQGWVSGVQGTVGLAWDSELKTSPCLCKAEGWERGKKNQGQPQFLQLTGELGLTTTALFQSNSVHGIVIKALYNPHPSHFYFSMWWNDLLRKLIPGGSRGLWLYVRALACCVHERLCV